MAVREVHMNRESIIPVLTEHVKKLPYKIMMMATDWAQRDLKRPHGVDFYLLMQCLSGEGHIIHHNKTINITPNDIFLWTPTVPQYYYNDGDQDWVVNWITFEAESIPLPIQEGFFVTHCFPTSLGLTHFHAMKQLLMDESISGQLRASSILYALLCEMNIHDYQLDDTHQGFELADVTGYMKQNINKHITLQHLSQIFNVSQSYLCRLFKRQFRVTPIQYFIQYKMNTAKALLILNPDEKICRIAELCGYDDPVYFSKVFKKYVHKTPSDYRKNNTM